MCRYPYLHTSRWRTQSGSAADRKPCPRQPGTAAVYPTSTLGSLPPTEARAALAPLHAVRLRLPGLCTRRAPAPALRRTAAMQGQARRWTAA